MKSNKLQWSNILNILLIVFLFFNFLFLIRSFGIIYFPGEQEPSEIEGEEFEIVFDYYRELADIYEVEKDEELDSLLGEFKYMLETSESRNELNEVFMNYASKIKESVFEQVYQEKLSGAEEIIRLQDKQLDEQREKINALEMKMSGLKKELDLVKEEAGYKKISGPGVIVRVYDYEGRLEEASIVHDNDIHLLINELFVAGARGIEVGGERLTATSSIRCVGPTILVNNNPVSVNPIEVKAVGEPRVLRSSLALIKERLKGFGIELEVSVHHNIELDAVN